jgi:hypothetical protein
LKDFHRWAEGAYQLPVVIAIFFKSLLSFLEQFKDGLRGIDCSSMAAKGLLQERSIPVILA